MKKKLLIGAGIVLAVFILFLIIICGGSGTDKVVTQEELEVTISTVTCDVKDDDSIDYDLALLTNDMTFEEYDALAKQVTDTTFGQISGQIYVAGRMASSGGQTETLNAKTCDCPTKTRYPAS